MSNNVDEQYLDLGRRILSDGVRKDDRTGTGTLSTFGQQMRFDLSEGFPLLTTKRIPFRIVAEELLWFLSGSTDVGDLVRKDVNIWNSDSYRWYKGQAESKGADVYSYDGFVQSLKDGYDFDLGPIYGAQWRAWTDKGGNTHDQIANVIESIRNNPDSRRHIVSAWNVGELSDMALPPCHTFFQFYVANGKLSCQLTQRSGDVFLGIPYNIASYSLLTHMIANITGLEVGEFIHTIGDAHIYTNHIEQVKEQIGRVPRELPQMKINRDIMDIDDFSIEDFEIVGYDPHSMIKGKLSV